MRFEKSMITLAVLTTFGINAQAAETIEVKADSEYFNTTIGSEDLATAIKSYDGFTGSFTGETISITGNEHIIDVKGISKTTTPSGVILGNSQTSTVEITANNQSTADVYGATIQFGNFQVNADNISLNIKSNSDKDYGLYVSASSTKLPAATATIGRENTDFIQLSVSSNNLAYGAYVTYHSNLSLTGNDIKVEVSGNTAYGFDIERASQLNLGSDATDTVNLSAEAKKTAYGIYVKQFTETTNAQVLGQDISITANAQTDGGYAVWANRNADVAIGNEKTLKVQLVGTSTNGKAYGIYTANTVKGNQDGANTTVSANELLIKGVSTDESAFGIYSGTLGNVVVGGQATSSLQVEGSSTGGDAYGLYSVLESTSSLDAQSINVKTDSNRGYSVAILSDSSESKVLGETISAISNSEGGIARSVVVQSDAKVTLGDASSTSLIELRATSNSNEGSAAASVRESALVINTNTLKATSDGKFGLHVQNNSEEVNPDDSVASLIVNAQNTTVKSNGSGLSAYSNGKMTVNGDLTVNAPIAVDARGYATMDINPTGSGVVTLNGDVAFETNDDGQSGKIIDAYVTLNLTKGSSLNGRSYMSVDGQQSVLPDNPPEANNSVTGFVMKLSDGASWNMTGDSFVNTLTAENGGAVNIQGAVSEFNADSVTLDNGVVNFESTNTNMTAKSLKGTGEIILSAEQNSDGTLQTSTISAVEAADATVAVTLSGVTPDQITDPKAALASVAESLSLADADVTTTITGGDIMEDIVGDAQGNMISGGGASNKIISLSSITAISTTQWRHEMNDLTKRMGELRDSPEGIGSWVRVYGSEQDYQGTKQKSTSVQVGADYALGDWVVGGAFSYTDGSTEYAQGSGDTKAYSLAAYGTWMADNGMFVDLIAKYSRLENDFSISNMAGSLDNNAYSVSAELGWRFDLNDYVYVEPQAELTYGRIVGDDTVTSNQVRIDQDDTDSFLGRIGLRAGLKFPENKGSVYARVSGVYDFDGESSAMFSNTASSQKLDEDLGGGWVEYAVGANFNLSPNAYTYVDLEKTSGGEVKQDWRWNVGLRYVW